MAETGVAHRLLSCLDMTRYLALGLSAIAALTIFACAADPPPLGDAKAAVSDRSEAGEDKEDRAANKPTARADGGVTAPASRADAGSEDAATETRSEVDIDQLLDDCAAQCPKGDEACVDKCFAFGEGDGADGADGAIGCCVGAQFFACPDEKAAGACTAKGAPGCKRDPAQDDGCAK